MLWQAAEDTMGNIGPARGPIKKDDKKQGKKVAESVKNNYLRSKIP